MKSLTMALSLASVLVLAACDKEAKEASAECIDDSKLAGIVGGSRVSEADEVSKQVVMLIGDNGKICTTTPIASDVLLTAAHCIEKTGVKYAAVFSTNVACSTGFKFSQSTIGVTEKVRHPDYTGRFTWISDVHNDVALVKLARPIPSNYQVIPLYDGRTQFADRVRLAGYGEIGENTGLRESATFLRQITKSYTRSLNIRQDQIIMEQRDSQGICQGDSGGPLFVYVNGAPQVAGVNSVVEGPKNRICHDRAVLMYVPAYLNWIKKELRNLR